MPLGVKPVCSVCNTVASTMWRKGDKGEVMCNGCGMKQDNEGKVPSGGEKMESESPKSSTPTPTVPKPHPPPRASISAMRIISEQSSNGLTRKSNRIKPGRGRLSTSSKNNTTKGKSRRAIFKKNPIRSPASVSTVITSDYVFFDNMYYQIGDIVSLLDHSGDVYYAQIRGFMQDQFLEKSAVITWLIPTQGYEKNKFDPSKYILGPEEDLPRKLEFMEFVCHAPSDYYKCEGAPYPTSHSGPDLCYVWTSLGPCITTLPSKEEIFGPYIEEDKEKVVVKSPREKDETKRKKKKEKPVLDEKD